MSFWATYWDVVAFYLLAVILLYLFRSRFEFQGIVALLRTKLGLKFMTETGRKHPVFWHRLGLLSITLGFIGMAFITVYLFYGLYSVFFVPSAPPVLSPVIPGVKIPGVEFTFPLWYTLIGLFFAVIVHEASHGIWASAYKIKIKSSGFAFIGPIPGAFVEPDEKTMTKRGKREQLAILAAGPFSNMVLAVIAFIFAILIGMVGTSLVTQEGVHVTTIANESGAQAAGMIGNVTISSFDGKLTPSLAAFSAAIDEKQPGDTVIVVADGVNYTVTLGENPDNAQKPYLGVLNLANDWSLKNDNLGWLYSTLFILVSVCMWTYILSLGIGIANLLPIGPVDGGRMFLITLTSIYADEKKAKEVWTRWSSLLLAVILIVLFVPIVKAIL